MVAIYRFGPQTDGDASMTTLLGGKGANLAEMARIGIPVPPGFTITTEVCTEYRQLDGEAREAFIGELMGEVTQHMTWLDEQFGFRPLVSVRSGAPVSMPGMMDTILNVGLTAGDIDDWAARIGRRAALDSQRRLIQMLGSTAYGVPHEVFEFQLAKVKQDAGVQEDTGLTAGTLEAVRGRYLKAFAENKGFGFPSDDPDAQLRAAVKAVFDSWMNPRAIEYRRMNKIPEEMGTAVNIQAMVFGNMGEDSGTGVLFSRNPSTGEAGVFGEFLRNAQGEDVVAGIRTPLPLSMMEQIGWNDLHEQILAIAQRLEQHYRDMMDVEFTVQQERLFLLQCRTGKRSALAAFRIAVALVEEGLISEDEALARLTPEQFKLATRPRVAEGFGVPPVAMGLPASIGVAVGKPVFSAEDAINCNESCVLVTRDTCPDDIAGMAKSAGILTANGGATSHAAVVARAMDKPCVTGCTDLMFDGACVSIQGQGMAFDGGSRVTIDGETGRVWIDVDVPVVDGSGDRAVRTVIAWCLRGRAIAVDAPLSEPPGGAMQCVMAAEWWHDADAARAAVRKLGEAGPERTVLDLRPPSEFLPEADLALGAVAHSAWDTALFTAHVLDDLVSAGLAARLKGLTVVGADAVAAGRLSEAGYRPVREAETVADLMEGDHAGWSPNLLKAVGGEQAMEKLLGVLERGGIALKPVPKPVTPEYAVFTRLGR